MKIFDLKYVKQRRIDLDLTLQEAAEGMKMKNASTYLKYENGTYSFKAEHLPLLAKILKCRIENFFIELVAKTAI